MDFTEIINGVAPAPARLRASASSYKITEEGEHIFKVIASIPTAGGGLIPVAEQIQYGAATPTSINSIVVPKAIVRSGIASIQAEFKGSAIIELSNVNGVLVNKTVGIDSFEQSGLASGLYIIKINGQTSKVLVK